MFCQDGGLAIFGWFGGMPPGTPYDPLTMPGGVLEFAGGMAVMFGIFTRPVAFILSGEMAVAYWKYHFPMGHWPVQNQGQPAVLYSFIFLFIAAYGGGDWSLDARLKSKLGSREQSAA